MVTVKTNRNWRDFVYRADVLKRNFSHLEGEDSLDGFFCYRGHWYHLSDFMRFGDSAMADEMPGWDGYAGDSYFSGVLLKVSSDGERYCVGTYFS